MSAGSNTYTATSTATATITLENESRVSFPDGSDVMIEGWWNLDRDADPEIQTISIDGVPVADAYIWVTIAGPIVTKRFTLYYDAIAGMTAAQVATELAMLINLHTDVTAQATDNNIIVTSVLPGTNGAFTPTVGCNAAADDSAVSGILSVTQTAEATGTGKVRKLLDALFELEIVNGFPALRLGTVRFFNGAIAPAPAGQQNIPPLTHPQRMDFLRNVP